MNTWALGSFALLLVGGEIVREPARKSSEVLEIIVIAERPEEGKPLRCKIQFWNGGKEDFELPLVQEFECLFWEVEVLVDGKEPRRIADVDKDLPRRDIRRKSLKAGGKIEVSVDLKIYHIHHIPKKWNKLEILCKGAPGMKAAVWSSVTLVKKADE